MERRGGTEVTIQGVTYRSLDEVPAKYRAFAAQFFEDADGNGVPDFIEQAETSGLTTHVDEMFIVNGTTYTSIDAVPEQHRAALERLAETPPSRSEPSDSSVPAGPAVRPAGERPTSIVTTAGPSSRMKRFVVVAITVVVVLGVIWLAAR